MTTRRELLPPASIPDGSWLSKLGSRLERRDDIAAAYLVTTRCFDPQTLRDELRLELSELPGLGGAPPAPFSDPGRALAGSGVSDFVFAFPPRAILTRVRDPGALVWSREERG